MPKIMLCICLVCIVLIIYGLIRNASARIKKKQAQKKLVEDRAKRGYSTREKHFSDIIDETMHK